VIPRVLPAKTLDWGAYEASSFVFQPVDDGDKENARRCRFSSAICTKSKRATEFTPLRWSSVSRRSVGTLQLPHPSIKESLVVVSSFGGTVDLRQDSQLRLNNFSVPTNTDPERASRLVSHLHCNRPRCEPTFPTGCHSKQHPRLI